MSKNNTKEAVWATTRQITALEKQCYTAADDTMKGNIQKQIKKAQLL